MKTPGAVFGRSAVRGSLSAGYGSPSPSQERTTKSGSPGGASGWQSQPGWSKSPWESTHDQHAFMNVHLAGSGGVQTEL